MISVLLAWLIPPVVGALIGYVTNVVAIKMLFRPLTEKRILGIRIPFTPGILPKQRHKLADSIGRMVERELLTPEILRQRIIRPEVADTLKNALSTYTQKLFNQPAEKWLPGISGYVVSGAEASYPHAAKAITNFMHRTDIRETMETQFRVMITKAILKMNAFQRFFISAGQYDKTIEDKVPDIVADLIGQLENLLNSEEGERKVINSIRNEILRLPEKNPDLCLEKILVPGKSWTGPSPKERLDSFLAEKILDTVNQQADSLLGTINVKTLVSDRINSLDMIRVERIILDVLAGQLWWINVVGGILGFLIGLSQSVLSLFL